MKIEIHKGIFFCTYEYYNLEWQNFIFFHRTVYEKGSLISEMELLQPLNMDITIERNLAAAWYNDIPDIKIIGHLKPMSVSFIYWNLRIRAGAWKWSIPEYNEITFVKYSALSWQIY